MDYMDSKRSILSERVTQVENRSSTLQEMETNLSESVEQTKKEVVTRCEKVRLAVDRWQDEILKDVESLCEKGKDEVKGKKVFMESYIDKLNETINEIDSLTKSGDEMMVLRKKEFEKKIKVTT